jgi:hypothetical protein
MYWAGRAKSIVFFSSSREEIEEDESKELAEASETEEDASFEQAPNKRAPAKNRARNFCFLSILSFYHRKGRLPSLQKREGV